MRYRILGGLLAIAACSLYAHIQTDEPQPATTLTVSASPAAADRASLDRPVPVSAVRAAIPLHQLPAPARRHALDMVALGAVVGATKKKATRRASGKKTEVPMYLDATAHVQRKNEDTGKMETVAIPGGVLVDDTDLNEDEIEELTAQRHIRPATSSEIERLEQADAAAERKEIVDAQAKETEQLRANQEVEMAKLNASGKASLEAISALQTEHAKQTAALQEKQAKALAK